MRKIYLFIYRMKAFKEIFPFLFTAFLVHSTSAQSYSEKGAPPIINYSPKEYYANTQNWACIQDDRGIMYFGNGTGLLEFDGANWRFYEVPNKTTIRSLAKGENGEIYAGAQGELGYFIPDSTGKLTFTSLKQFIPEDWRIFADIWNTCVVDGKVYFNSTDCIFIWDTRLKKFKIIPTENGFHIMSLVNGKIYIREWGKGIEEIKNDSLILLNGGEQFANERNYVTLPFPGEEGTILIVTRTKGLFKYDGKGFTPFKTEADDFIKENLIYMPGTLLSDGNILLGTLNGGAVVIDKNGKEIQRYNIQNGIISNKIYYTTQDRYGAIWLSTDNGISRIDYASPVNYFNSGANMISAVSDIIRHNGIIYVATNDGIYNLDPSTFIFHKLKNEQSQAFGFLEFQGNLLVGTYYGLFRIENDGLVPVRRTVGNEYNATVLTQSKSNPNRIFVGASEGIWSILHENNKWIDEGQILNITDQFYTLIENESGQLWASTAASGLFRITFQKDDKGNIMLKNPSVEHFMQESGLQEGITYVSIINGTKYFTTTDSIYKLDENKRMFLQDTTDVIMSAFYNTVHGNYNLVIPFQDNMGRIWFGIKGKITMGLPQTDDSWKWESTPFNRIADEEISKIYMEKNGVVWFGIGNGVIKYDLGKKILNTSFPALVRNVQIGSDSTIYFGGKLESHEIPEIGFKNNSIKFRYSATSFESKNTTKFKTFLEGFDKHWSSWGTENTKEYTNLKPGKYTFNVTALNILGNESSVATYSFRIMSPWYRTWWSYTLMVLLFAGFLRAYILYRSRRLIAEKKVLERRVSERTKELEDSLETIKSTQAQLIQSEKMASLGELTAGIAHEIQNPLNFVNNFSDLNKELVDELKEELAAGNTQLADEIANDIKENETKINHHGKRAESIVKGMLLHSRGSVGQKEFTDINAICDEYLRLSYHGFRAKDKSFNAGFKLEADPDLPKVNVIPQDIGRVLLNLINNAFYAVNEKVKQNVNDYKPTVVVITKLLGNEVEIKVQDNGNGIPNSVKEKIFQPFFTTKPTGQGTGLGLSLSYDIVKAHGGELRVASETEGTTFIISLPSKQLKET